MADPITWAIIAGGIGAVSAIQQGNAASAAAQSEAQANEYNAAMADIQAKQAYAAAGVQEEEQRRKSRQIIGMQLASSAEAGAGLNGDLLRQSIYDTESDAMAIRYEGDLKAQGFKDTATLQRNAAIVNRNQAKSARTAGYLNAAGAIAGAGNSYYKGKSLNRSTS